jgi:PhnB protein
MISRSIQKEEGRMADAVKSIPAGYHTVTPYLAVKGAAEAIEFYKNAFDAEEIFRMYVSDGKTIGHAEIRIGDSHIQLCDENPEMGYGLAPQSLGGNTVNFLVYVEDVDRLFNQAVAAGAAELTPLGDQFWGDRIGTVKDPFGHVWTIATHKKDVSVEETKEIISQI